MSPWSGGLSGTGDGTVGEGSCLTVSFGSGQMSPFQTSGSSSLRINALTFSRGTLFMSPTVISQPAQLHFVFDS